MKESFIINKMFHNIFKQTRKKLKQNQSNQKPIIIADIHEKNSLVISELQSNNQINLEIKSLKIADYLIGKTAIERKTTSDFISSMINKRLIQQLNQIQKYKNKLLIIEGNPKNLTNKESKLNPNAIRGFILSIINNYQIPIIFTQDHEDTANYLITLAKQQLKKPIQPSFHSRIPKNIKEQKQYILESFPNIGPKTAEKLLKKFKTINNIFNATNEDLKPILKSRTVNFKRLLDS